MIVHKPNQTGFQSKRVCVSEGPLLEGLDGIESSTVRLSHVENKINASTVEWTAGPMGREE